MLFDFEIFDMANDLSYQKTYYVHRSPTPLFSHRDFVLEQKLYWDFPEPEMLTCCIHSIKDDRLPERKGRVRADCHNMTLVLRPDKNFNGTDITHAMLIFCIDINGMVPKRLVNYVAETAPAEWFADCLRGCENLKAGRYGVKPEEIDGWRIKDPSQL